MPVLLSAAYCPPVQYFAAMAEEFTLSPDRVIPSIVYIEACENYQKQSYRNRCRYYAGNGAQTLSFPIVHVDGTHNNIHVREVKVDYTMDWVTRHERAIESAYRTSAYFDYYADELFDFDERIKRIYALDYDGVSRAIEGELDLSAACVAYVGREVDKDLSERFLSRA